MMPMRRVVFVENEEHVGPGLFATVLGEAGVELEVIRAWRGEPVPEGPAGWDGIALGGGGMSANDVAEFPWLETEKRLIRAARERGTPVLGMCLGAQLIAAAFGARVYRNLAREFGFLEVRCTPAAADDPLWRGWAAPFSPAHWHGETFDLPTGAVLLGASDLTAHQFFRIGETVHGLQFHLEFDLATLRIMVEMEADGLAGYGIDPAEFLRGAAAALPRVEPLARAVFGRWVGR